jgi:hypothetical protein
MNFYLRIRKNNTLRASEKFVVSLISIFVLFFIFYTSAYFFGEKFAKMMNPTFNIAFTVMMNLILPIVTTELVLSVYLHYTAKRKK